MDTKIQSLIKWLQTFTIDVPHKSVQQLSDGVAMAQVLKQIAPEYFDETFSTKIKADVSDNWRLKASNLKKVLKGIIDYLEMLDISTLEFPTPDVQMIAEHSNSTETGRLLQLILACAVNCPAKDEYINIIMSLEESVQHAVMTAIQELMPKEPSSASDSFSENQSIEDLKRLIEEANRNKAKLTHQCQELELQVSHLNEEKSTLQQENEKLQEKMSQTEDPSGGRRLVQLQHKMEFLQDECYKIETSRDDYKAKFERQQKEITDLQIKNDELQKLAEEARVAKDELDVLRHTSDKVAQYEITIESYKKKLEEMSDMKRQHKLLEEANTTYVQRNMELEEEVKRQGALRSQLEVYKKQVQELHSKGADDSRQIDKKEFDIKRLSEKLASVQQERDRLLVEKSSLKETIEELKCDQLNNEMNVRTPTPWLIERLFRMYPDHTNPMEGLSLSDTELLGVLPQCLKEKLIRLQYENKMLKKGREDSGDHNVLMLQNLVEDYKSRQNKLEVENRQANQKILELEGHLSDIQESGHSNSDLKYKVSLYQSKIKEMEGELVKRKALVDSAESQLQSSMQKGCQLQEQLSKKEEEMSIMEERYRKYLDRAKNVIRTLDSKGTGPEIVALQNQLVEKNKIIASLENQVEKSKTQYETEQRMITTAFYNMGSHLQRRAAEERLGHLSPQTFLSRQRQASTRRLNMPEVATSEFFEQ